MQKGKNNNMFQIQAHLALHEINSPTILLPMAEI